MPVFFFGKRAFLYFTLKKPPKLFFVILNKKPQLHLCTITTYQKFFKNY